MPRIERSAQVTWEGNLARGTGHVSADTGAFAELPISLPSRIGNPDGKTSPEELLAAAHAGCLATSVAGELHEGGDAARGARADGARHRGRGRGKGPRRRRVRGGRQRPRPGPRRSWIRARSWRRPMPVARSRRSSGRARRSPCALISTPDRGAAARSTPAYAHSTGLSRPRPAKPTVRSSVTRNRAPTNGIPSSAQSVSAFAHAARLAARTFHIATHVVEPSKRLVRDADDSDRDSSRLDPFLGLREQRVDPAEVGVLRAAAAWARSAASGTSRRARAAGRG